MLENGLEKQAHPHLTKPCVTAISDLRWQWHMGQWQQVLTLALSQTYALRKCSWWILFDLWRRPQGLGRCVAVPMYPLGQEDLIPGTQESSLWSPWANLFMAEPRTFLRFTALSGASCWQASCDYFSQNNNNNNYNYNYNNKLPFVLFRVLSEWASCGCCDRWHKRTFSWE